MKYPKSKKGLRNRIAFSCYRFWRSSFWVRWLLAPAATGVLPTITLAYYKLPDLSNAVGNKFPGFANWMNSSEVIILLIVFIYPTLVIAFARFVLNRVNSSGVNQEVLLSLIASLDQIVGCKAERFGSYVTKFAQAGKTQPPSETFDIITQPVTQIAEITRGVWSLFNSIMFDSRTRSQIKVVLAEVRDGTIVDLPIFFPQDEPPRTDLGKLNQPNSTIMSALKSKKMVIIESTLKESAKGKKARYVASDEDGDDSDCSLICYPIRHKPTNSIPLLLSIHSDEANMFKEEHRELYEHLLGRFESRMCLEYSLKLIKEEVA